jgi:D-arginine dehydrogenase
MHSADIVVVGAGMAGASLAAEVAPHRSVLILEAEAHPGHHATGRSAAFWSECYGGPLVQPLTSASGPWLRDPPPDFHDSSFLRARGALTLAREADHALLEAECARFAGSGVMLEWFDRSAIERRIPGVRPGWTVGLFEPGCSDIDVAALHGAYLKIARRRGAELRVDAPVTSLERSRGMWRIRTPRGAIEAPVLVNASGAWADSVARLAGLPPIGIQPYRRTIAQLRTDPLVPPDLPLVMDARGTFYFKPEAGGRLWLSPHDETASEPCDTSPEELDIALALDRLEQVVDWRVDRLEHSWAGLRSFAPDRLPVYGFDPRAEGFFWCAGQGGFGIQTAPAAAQLAAALLLGESPRPLAAGIDPAPYSAARFAN